MKVLIAPVAGFVLGFADFVWIKFVPFPFGGLGNSSAVWALAAFLFAYWRRRRTGVLESVVLLVVAIPSYYLAATLIQGDDLANVWNPFWTLAAVVAGVVFGLAGVVARRSDRWAVAALAVPVAVTFAEAGLQLARPDRTTGDVEHAVLMVVLGLLITLGITTTWPRRAAAIGLALPIAAAGYGLFRAAGFVF